jgi:selenocysteine lyase/cysteine desulfurase
MFALKSIYLNAAYLGPMPLKAKENVDMLSTRLLDPAFFPHSDWRQFPDQVRERFAKLLNGKADQVAVSTSVSELMSHIADASDLNAEDEVILMEGDYPSVVLPWLVRAERAGFSVKLLPLADFQEPARLKKQLTAKTKVVACSHVMFNTGLRLPAEEIARLCRERDILYVADVSQSFGGMTLSPELVNNAGALVGVAYKWLLGPYGSAFGYFSPLSLEKLKRTHASWLQNPNSQNSENLLMYSTASTPGARKFDRGQAPSYLIMTALMGSLDVIAEKGLPAIERYNSELVKHFYSILPKTYNPLAAEPQSNIVCINQQGLDTAALKERLAKSNIDVSIREGSLRVSFHFFNTKSDVEALAADM